MDVKGMILAAGHGTRLRPLTNHLPKPVIPLANEPLAAFSLRLLAELGIERVRMNLHHLPEAITAVFGRGSDYGLKLSYAREKKLMGTGGALSRAAKFFGDHTAVIINGDILFDLDLRKALAFHRRKKALATMVLVPHQQVERFGAVELDSHARIRRIAGYPSDGAKRPFKKRYVFSGVHILEPAFFKMLPRNRACCVVRTAYFKLLEEDTPLFGYVEEGHWSDLGTPSRYYQVNLDILNGRIPITHLKLQAPSPSPEHIIIGEGATLSREVKLIPPVLIGKGANIGKGARVGPSVTIGDGAVLGGDTVISRSLVWPGGRLKHNSIIKDSVVIGNQALWSKE